MEDSSSPTASGGAFRDADRTARARIRDAAIARIAADGVAATSLKAIATDAGVSAPLVIHHFGSKEGLLAACDEYVVAWIRARGDAGPAAGGGVDPLHALRDAFKGEPPLIRYLARTLAEGTEHVAALIDDLVEHSLQVYTAGLEQGVFKQVENPRQAAVVMTLSQLGALVLHEHAERLLGFSPVGGSEDAIAWNMASAEVLSGVIDADFYAKWSGRARPPYAEGER